MLLYNKNKYYLQIKYISTIWLKREIIVYIKEVINHYPSLYSKIDKNKK